MLLAEDSSRRFPLLSVDAAQLEALLAPLLDGRAPRLVEPVAGGLTNTIFRVFPEGGHRALLVRIFAGGFAAWSKERRLLTHGSGGLPVPRLLLADAGQGAVPYPTLVFEWIEGTTLNAFRKARAPEQVLAVAGPLGTLLARLGATKAPEAVVGNRGSVPASSLEALLASTEQRLSTGRARSRLGARLADGLWAHCSREARRIPPLGETDCLVHGDFGGRNILIAPSDGRLWLIDWEEASAGWAWWDIGSLFRYPRRYDAAFRTRFEDGYRAGGGTLPEGWWRTARLLDAMRQLATLEEEHERPATFADCRQLLEVLVRNDC